MTASSERARRALAAAALAVAAAAVYARALSYGFSILDDPGYVAANRHVAAGLGWSGFRWAFTTFHESNWHPLTWLSLMLDAEIAGLDPRMFHLTNVVLHVANALLLFLFLERATGATGRSALAAALFALHPLRVESVVWIAERKDVLSTFFLMLALLAHRARAERPSARRSLAVTAAFALGLLSKPMLVTLPALLLLLDWWPLGRLGDRPAAAAPRSFRGLLLEKVPLAALSLASAAITLIAQERGGALRALEHYPLPWRLANAVVSSAGYLAKTVWPDDLAVYYPHPRGTLSAAQVGAAALLLAAITAAALAWRRSRPYLAVGWSWYLIALVPVVGLVQVGGQAMADRYTYVPLIGLFVTASWGAADLAQRSGRRAARGALAPIAAVLVLGALAWRTHEQIGRWKDNVTLFEHAIRVTGDNPVAQNALGNARFRGGDLARAAAHYAEAVRIAPAFADAHANLAAALINQGRVAEAERPCRRALQLDPSNARTHANLALVLLEKELPEEAARHLREAVRIAPELVDARVNLGAILARGGRLDEAIAEFSRALEFDPAHREARLNLEMARRAKAER